ncbi:hypothetical protein BDQ17DRAFT_1544638 [Cyathus striatus]|nr:hypothetical protein BDQ17DRAFT_1544638 [Cyathus striatus]
MLKLQRVGPGTHLELSRYVPLVLFQFGHVTVPWDALGAVSTGLEQAYWGGVGVSESLPRTSSPEHPIPLSSLCWLTRASGLQRNSAAQWGRARMQMLQASEGTSRPHCLAFWPSAPASSLLDVIMGSCKDAVGGALLFPSGRLGLCLKSTSQYWASLRERTNPDACDRGWGSGQRKHTPSTDAYADLFPTR